MLKAHRAGNAIAMLYHSNAHRNDVCSRQWHSEAFAHALADHSILFYVQT